MRTQRIITLGLILVVLLGSNFFINKWRTEDDTKVNYGDYYTFFKSTDDVQEFKINTLDYHYTLVLKEDKWVNADSEVMPMSQDEIKNLTYELYNMSSESKLDAVNLSEYGLEEPYAEIQVKLGNGSSNTLTIGNKTSSNEYYYVRKDAENSIYTVAASKIEDLVRPLSALRSKQLYKYSEEKANEVEKIAFDTVELVRNEEDGVWTMTAPFNDREINGSNLNEYVFANFNLLIDEFIEDAPGSYAKYGLDNPEHKIEVKLKEQEKPIKVLLGYEKDGKVYAKTDDQPYVFMIRAENIAFVETDPLLLVSTLVYIKNISEVEKITFKAGDKTSVIEIDDENEKYIVNDKEVNVDKFKSLYQEIIGLLIIDVAEENAQRNDLICSMKFEFNTDAEDDIVEIYSNGDRDANVSVNGEIKYTVSKEQVQALINSIEKY
ncbi:MAG: DUF4340 domain-containing protein [Clostridia bacterium]|nr:DUF4340 domain-containing protein [Clostridia bacterium]